MSSRSARSSAQTTRLRLLIGSAAMAGRPNGSRVRSPSAPTVEIRRSAPICVPAADTRWTQISSSAGVAYPSAVQETRYSPVPPL